MKLLLDTCTFLFLISDFERIPANTRQRLAALPLTVSTLTLWEILIRIGKGQLRIATPDAHIRRYPVKTLWD